MFLGLRSAIIVRVIRITTASRSTAAADPTPAAMAAINQESVAMSNGSSKIFKP